MNTYSITDRKLFPNSILEGIDGIQQAEDPKEKIAGLTLELLSALGEDPNREGLLQTPQRVARMYTELLSGYQTDLDALVNGAIFTTTNQDMVLVRDIEFYSMCEHHMLPFFGHAHVAYIPNGMVIGLSKIPRIVDMFARRLQVQENLTQQIADTLTTVIQPKGVAVLLEGSHMCSSMRGVRKPSTRMVTTTLLGDFKTDESLQRRFFLLAQQGGRNREVESD